eukprot:Cvel_15349.t1-p1 / transcript=Cvel_15349.t1 / gene=Cvel_15349 / organism=Chromera_velia_CCMP2878 / gene_product=hypothetical protein / transcript_product=hypothetical protein / location=Cvel_scaffold1130:264-29698(-) / protein_length=5167 / sequence_SO=supercontig / SO=protein_coding / is_pseudo=false
MHPHYQTQMRASHPHAHPQGPVDEQSRMMEEHRRKYDKWLKALEKGNTERDMGEKDTAVREIREHAESPRFHQLHEGVYNLFLSKLRDSLVHTVRSQIEAKPEAEDDTRRSRIRNGIFRTLLGLVKHSASSKNAQFAHVGFIFLFYNAAFSLPSSGKTPHGGKGAGGRSVEADGLFTGPDAFRHCLEMALRREEAILKSVQRQKEKEGPPQESASAAVLVPLPCRAVLSLEVAKSSVEVLSLILDIYKEKAFPANQQSSGGNQSSRQGQSGAQGGHHQQQQQQGVGNQSLGPQEASSLNTLKMDLETSIKRCTAVLAWLAPGAAGEAEAEKLPLQRLIVCANAHFAGREAEESGTRQAERERDKSAPKPASPTTQRDKDGDVDMVGDGTKGVAGTPGGIEGAARRVTGISPHAPSPTAGLPRTSRGGTASNSSELLKNSPVTLESFVSLMKVLVGLMEKVFVGSSQDRSERKASIEWMRTCWGHNSGQAERLSTSLSRLITALPPWPERKPAGRRGGGGGEPLGVCWQVQEMCISLKKDALHLMILLSQVSEDFRNALATSPDRPLLRLLEAHSSSPLRDSVEAAALSPGSVSTICLKPSIIFLASIAIQLDHAASTDSHGGSNPQDQRVTSAQRRLRGEEGQLTMWRYYCRIISFQADALRDSSLPLICHAKILECWTRIFGTSRENLFFPFWRAAGRSVVAEIVLPSVATLSSDVRKLMQQHALELLEIRGGGKTERDGDRQRESAKTVCGANSVTSSLLQSVGSAVVCAAAGWSCPEAAAEGSRDNRGWGFWVDCGSPGDLLEVSSYCHPDAHKGVLNPDLRLLKLSDVMRNIRTNAMLGSFDKTHKLLISPCLSAKGFVSGPSDIVVQSTVLAKALIRYSLILARSLVHFLSTPHTAPPSEPPSASPSASPSPSSATAQTTAQLQTTTSGPPRGVPSAETDAKEKGAGAGASGEVRAGEVTVTLPAASSKEGAYRLNAFLQRRNQKFCPPKNAVVWPLPVRETMLVEQLVTDSFAVFHLTVITVAQAGSLVWESNGYLHKGSRQDGVRDDLNAPLWWPRTAVSYLQTSTLGVGLVTRHESVADSETRDPLLSSISHLLSTLHPVTVQAVLHRTSEYLLEVTAAVGDSAVSFYNLIHNLALQASPLVLRVAVETFMLAVSSRLRALHGFSEAEPPHIRVLRKSREELLASLSLSPDASHEKEKKEEKQKGKQQLPARGGSGGSWYVAGVGGQTGMSEASIGAERPYRPDVYEQATQHGGGGLERVQGADWHLEAGDVWEAEERISSKGGKGAEAILQLQRDRSLSCGVTGRETSDEDVEMGDHEKGGVEDGDEENADASSRQRRKGLPSTPMRMIDWREDCEGRLRTRVYVRTDEKEANQGEEGQGEGASGHPRGPRAALTSAAAEMIYCGPPPLGFVSGVDSDVGEPSGVRASGPSVYELGLPVGGRLSVPDRFRTLALEWEYKQTGSVLRVMKREDMIESPLGLIPLLVEHRETATVLSTVSQGVSTLSARKTEFPSASSNPNFTNAMQPHVTQRGNSATEICRRVILYLFRCMIQAMTNAAQGVVSGQMPSSPLHFLESAAVILSHMPAVSEWSLLSASCLHRAVDPLMVLRTFAAQVAQMRMTLLQYQQQGLMASPQTLTGQAVQLFGRLPFLKKFGSFLATVERVSADLPPFLRDVLSEIVNHSPLAPVEQAPYLSSLLPHVLSSLNSPDSHIQSQAATTLLIWTENLLPQFLADLLASGSSSARNENGTPQSRGALVTALLDALAPLNSQLAAQYDKEIQYLIGNYLGGIPVSSRLRENADLKFSHVLRVLGRLGASLRTLTDPPVPVPGLRHHFFDLLEVPLLSACQQVEVTPTPSPRDATAQPPVAVVKREETEGGGEAEQPDDDPTGPPRKRTRVDPAESEDKEQQMEAGEPEEEKPKTAAEGTQHSPQPPASINRGSSASPNRPFLLLPFNLDAALHYAVYTLEVSQLSVMPPMLYNPGQYANEFHRSYCTTGGLVFDTPRPPLLGSMTEDKTPVHIADAAPFLDTFGKVSGGGRAVGVWPCQGHGASVELSWGLRSGLTSFRPRAENREAALGILRGIVALLMPGADLTAASEGRTAAENYLLKAAAVGSCVSTQGWEKEWSGRDQKLEAKAAKLCGQLAYRLQDSTEIALDCAAGLRSGARRDADERIISSLIRGLCIAAGGGVDAGLPGALCLLEGVAAHVGASMASRAFPLCKVTNIVPLSSLNPLSVIRALVQQMDAHPDCEGLTSAAFHALRVSLKTVASLCPFSADVLAVSRVALEIARAVSAPCFERGWRRKGAGCLAILAALQSLPPSFSRRFSALLTSSILRIFNDAGENEAASPDAGGSSTSSLQAACSGQTHSAVGGSILFETPGDKGIIAERLAREALLTLISVSFGADGVALGACFRKGKGQEEEECAEGTLDGKKGETSGYLGARAYTSSFFASLWDINQGSGTFLNEGEKERQEKGQKARRNPNPSVTLAEYSGEVPESVHSFQVENKRGNTAEQVEGSILLFRRALFDVTTLLTDACYLSKRPGGRIVGQHALLALSAEMGATPSELLSIFRPFDLSENELPVSVSVVPSAMGEETGGRPMLRLAVALRDTSLRLASPEVACGLLDAASFVLSLRPPADLLQNLPPEEAGGEREKEKDVPSQTTGGKGDVSMGVDSTDEKTADSGTPPKNLAELLQRFVSATVEVVASSLHTGGCLSSSSFSGRGEAVPLRQELHALSSASQFADVRQQVMKPHGPGGSMSLGTLRKREKECPLPGTSTALPLSSSSSSPAVPQSSDTALDSAHASGTAAGGEEEREALSASSGERDHREKDPVALSSSSSAERGVEDPEEGEERVDRGRRLALLLDSLRVLKLALLHPHPLWRELLQKDAEGEKRTAQVAMERAGEESKKETKTKSSLERKIAEVLVKAVSCEDAEIGVAAMHVVTSVDLDAFRRGKDRDSSSGCSAVSAPQQEKGTRGSSIILSLAGGLPFILGLLRQLLSLDNLSVSRLAAVSRLLQLFRDDLRGHSVSREVGCWILSAVGALGDPGALGDLAFPAVSANPASSARGSTAGSTGGGNSSGTDHTTQRGEGGSGGHGGSVWSIQSERTWIAREETRIAVAVANLISLLPDSAFVFAERSATLRGNGTQEAENASAPSGPKSKEGAAGRKDGMSTQRLAAIVDGLIGSVASADHPDGAPIPDSPFGSVASGEKIQSGTVGGTRASLERNLAGSALYGTPNSPFKRVLLEIFCKWPDAAASVILRRVGDPEVATVFAEVLQSPAAFPVRRALLSLSAVGEWRKVMAAQTGALDHDAPSYAKGNHGAGVAARGLCLIFGAVCSHEGSELLFRRTCEGVAACPDNAEEDEEEFKVTEEDQMKKTEKRGTTNRTTVAPSSSSSAAAASVPSQESRKIDAGGAAAGPRPSDPDADADVEGASAGNLKEETKDENPPEEEEEKGKSKEDHEEDDSDDGEPFLKSPHLHPQIKTMGLVEAFIHLIWLPSLRPLFASAPRSISTTGADTKGYPAAVGASPQTHSHSPNGLSGRAHVAPAAPDGSGISSVIHLSSSCAAEAATGLMAFIRAASMDFGAEREEETMEAVRALRIEVIAALAVSLLIPCASHHVLVRENLSRIVGEMGMSADSDADISALFGLVRSLAAELQSSSDEEDEHEKVFATLALSAALRFVVTPVVLIQASRLRGEVRAEKFCRIVSDSTAAMRVASFWAGEGGLEGFLSDVFGKLRDSVSISLRRDLLGFAAALSPFLGQAAGGRRDGESLLLRGELLKFASPRASLLPPPVPAPEISSAVPRDPSSASSGPSLASHLPGSPPAASAATTGDGGKEKERGVSPGEKKTPAAGSAPVGIDSPSESECDWALKLDELASQFVLCADAGLCMSSVISKAQELLVFLGPSIHAPPAVQSLLRRVLRSLPVAVCGRVLTLAPSWALSLFGRGRLGSPLGGMPSTSPSSAPTAGQGQGQLPGQGQGQTQSEEVEQQRLAEKNQAAEILENLVINRVSRHSSLFYGLRFLSFPFISQLWTKATSPPNNLTSEAVSSDTPVARLASQAAFVVSEWAQRWAFERAAARRHENRLSKGGKLERTVDEWTRMRWQRASGEEVSRTFFFEDAGSPSISSTEERASDGSTQRVLQAWHRPVEGVRDGLTCPHPPRSIREWEQRNTRGWGSEEFDPGATPFVVLTLGESQSSTADRAVALKIALRLSLCLQKELFIQSNSHRSDPDKERRGLTALSVARTLMLCHPDAPFPADFASWAQADRKKMQRTVSELLSQERNKWLTIREAIVKEHEHRTRQRMTSGARDQVTAHYVNVQQNAQREASVYQQLNTETSRISFLRINAVILFVFEMLLMTKTRPQLKRELHTVLRLLDSLFQITERGQMTWAGVLIARLMQLFPLDAPPALLGNEKIPPYRLPPERRLHRRLLEAVQHGLRHGSTLIKSTQLTSVPSETQKMYTQVFQHHGIYAGFLSRALACEQACVINENNRKSQLILECISRDPPRFPEGLDLNSLPYWQFDLFAEANEKKEEEAQTALGIHPSVGSGSGSLSGVGIGGPAGGQQRRQAADGSVESDGGFLVHPSMSLRILLAYAVQPGDPEDGYPKPTAAFSDAQWEARCADSVSHEQVNRLVPGTEVVASWLKELFALLQSFSAYSAHFGGPIGTFWAARNRDIFGFFGGTWTRFLPDAYSGWWVMMMIEIVNLLHMTVGFMDEPQIQNFIQSMQNCFLRQSSSSMWWASVQVLGRLLTGRAYELPVGTEGLAFLRLRMLAKWSVEDAAAETEREVERKKKKRDEKERGATGSALQQMQGGAAVRAPFQLPVGGIKREEGKIPTTAAQDEPMMAIEVTEKSLGGAGELFAVPTGAGDRSRHPCSPSVDRDKGFTTGGLPLLLADRHVRRCPENITFSDIWRLHQCNRVKPIYGLETRRRVIRTLRRTGFFSILKSQNIDTIRFPEVTTALVEMMWLVAAAEHLRLPGFEPEPAPVVPTLPLAPVRRSSGIAGDHHRPVEVEDVDSTDDEEESFPSVRISDIDVLDQERLEVLKGIYKAPEPPRERGQGRASRRSSEAHAPGGIEGRGGHQEGDHGGQAGVSSLDPEADEKDEAYNKLDRFIRPAFPSTPRSFWMEHRSDLVYYMGSASTASLRHG